MSCPNSLVQLQLCSDSAACFGLSYFSHRGCPIDSLKRARSSPCQYSNGDLYKGSGGPIINLFYSGSDCLAMGWGGPNQYSYRNL